MKLLVWGCGERCTELMEKEILPKEKIIAFIDNDENKKEFYGVPVYNPTKLGVLEECDYVLITTMRYEDNYDIFEQIKKLKFPMQRVLFLTNGYKQCYYLEERINEK